jgi:hypothetical protein
MVTTADRMAKRVKEAREKRAMHELCYHGKMNPNIGELAETAGSTEKELRRVFGELCKKPFSASLEMFDVTKPHLAASCKQLLKDPRIKASEKITLIKLLLRTFGETIEEQAQSTVNVNSPKALVVVGSSKKQIAEMLQPAKEPKSA